MVEAVVLHKISIILDYQRLLNYLSIPLFIVRYLKYGEESHDAGNHWKNGWIGEAGLAIFCFCFDLVSFTIYE